MQTDDALFEGLDLSKEDDLAYYNAVKIDFFLSLSLPDCALKECYTPGVLKFCSPTAAAFVQSVLARDAAQQTLDGISAPSSAPH